MIIDMFERSREVWSLAVADTNAVAMISEFQNLMSYMQVTYISMHARTHV